MNVLAIDSGVTKTAAAVVAKDGTILGKTKRLTGIYTRHNIFCLYESIVKEYQQEFEIHAVGISTNGAVDDKEGVVVYADDVSPEWTGARVAKEMRRRCQLPFAVQNDGKAAILGEGAYGAAKGRDHYFGIFLGTGVVGGYVTEGRLLRGSSYGFGEVAHMILHPGGRGCQCGQHGCVEQYCSGTALYRIFNDRSGKQLSSGHAFFERIAAQDALAEDILGQFAENLAFTLISVVNLLDPSLILVGGGLADTRAYWWDAFVGCYQSMCSSHLKEVEILPASMGNDAALLGVAKMAEALCT